jgi:ABC-type multidrug transport system ATPase subunit
MKQKKTVVMIAHTLSIVKNADQILVVPGGKIAEAGTHGELLAKGGKYAAMWSAERIYRLKPHSHAFVVLVLPPQLTPGFSAPRRGLPFSACG